MSRLTCAGAIQLATIDQTDCLSNPLEQAGYLEFGGENIYSVLHGVVDPIARVLLVGPFASERFFSYVPWVRWARFLAARRMEALRFDYCGVGESTGLFENMSFEDWYEEVVFLAGWLKDRSPAVPLILHGLELGTLLAGRTFAAGAGDALLLWGAPANGNEVLRRPLARQAFTSFYKRKALSDYARQLEMDQALEVEGYSWSGRLWRESFSYDAPLAADCKRPVRQVRLEGSPGSLLRGSSLGFSVSLNPDLSDLFTDNFEWMSGALTAPQGRQH